MIDIYVYRKGAVGTAKLDELQAITKEEPEAVYWIDMHDPTPEEEDAVLASTMQFHPLAIMDCRRERVDPNRGDHLPKVEDYGRYIFSIINPIELGPADDSGMPVIATRQLNVFLGHAFIVTHHYEPARAIEEVVEACSRNAMHLGRGPDYIYHLILDAIVDDYTPILDVFDEHIEDLEDVIFHGAPQTALPQLLSMKRQAFKLRRITTYQREMVYRLSRGEFPLVTQDEIAYYRNVFDHLVRAAELAESYRDILTGLLDAYLSMTSNRMNEIMKMLTIISTIFLPLTFIVGLYGMNFDTSSSPYNMPELKWALGYPMVWAIMIATSIGMLIYFRRKKWI
ncbi:MAG TPA: magnesium/cobalt transporter CorA [Candidatus Kapabacteria bacterium]|nr:magnesium/cobalt transporter CorA [Candidatus Kapabacteria bacterium]